MPDERWRTVTGDDDNLFHRLAGVEALKDLRPKDAEAEFRKALLAKPDDPRATALLASALQEQDRSVEAVELCEAWLARSLEVSRIFRAEIDFELGMAYARIDPSKSIDAFKRAVREDPDVLRQLDPAARPDNPFYNPKVHARASRRSAEFAAGMSADGLTALRDSLDAYSRDVDTALSAAVIVAKLITTIAPSRIEDFCRLAELLVRTGKSREARVAIDHALVLQPGCESALRLLEQMAESVEACRRRAEESWGRAASRGTSESWHYAALDFLLADDSGRAEDAMRRAAGLNPDEKRWIWGVGVCLALQGKEDAAIETITRATTLNGTPYSLEGLRPEQSELVFDLYRRIPALKRRRR